MRARVPVSDVVLTLLLLAVFAGGFGLSLSWPNQSALFPRLITGVGVALAMVRLLRLAWRRGGADSTADSTADTAREAATDASADGLPGADLGYVFARASGRAWLAALGWLALFFVALWTVGVLVAFPLFTVPYLYFSGRTRWWTAVSYAAVFSGVFYLAFVQLLRVPIPGGLA